MITGRSNSTALSPRRDEDELANVRRLAYEWREKFWAGQRSVDTSEYHRARQRQLEECYEQLIRVLPEKK